MALEAQTVWSNGPIFVVEERENPSTDFFVLPAIGANANVRRCGFLDVPHPLELNGAVVIFVRYVPAAWARLLEKERARLHRLALFMDDDLLDHRAAAGMPLRYRLKLLRLATLRRNWLRRQHAELWVSTPYLQQKYADWNPRLVRPLPIELPSRVRKVFYHGSASHDAEIRWLRPVMEQVLRRHDGITFEIVGTNAVNRYYRGLPRVTIVHPMPWPTYKAFLASNSRHIGLAPLLDLPFNKARSYTKFFDITSCGAVGIFSPGSAAAEIIQHGVDGLVIELDPELWAEAILDLATNESKRTQLVSAARSHLQQLSSHASGTYPDMGRGPNNQ